MINIYYFVQNLDGLLISNIYIGMDYTALSMFCSKTSNMNIFQIDGEIS